MGKAERRKKDGNMAAMLKKLGVERTTFRAPCGHTVGVGQANILRHFASCKR